ncbi:MAG: hypothetical protein K2O45_17295, partial [Oscillospiraceae bacterium]|nr:hypothetical protein [Oscillospiraceae bacterium]
MINYKTVSIPSLKLTAGQWEFSLHGGFLFVNGTPVQSYFSRNMFYWEEEGVQGAIYLNHYGLMANVLILQDGKKTIYQAGSEVHYAINHHNDAGDHEMDLCFGITLDSIGQTHYYCGLVYDKQVIIPVPKDDQSKQAQNIMSVTVTEKELLKIVLDTGNYRSIDTGFSIASMEMVFDAAYNNCDLWITEGILKADSYPASIDQNSITGVDAAKGICQLDYQDESGNKHTVQLETDSIKTKDRIHYYGSVLYDGKTALEMPTTEEDKAKQNFISCIKLSNKWNIRLRDLRINNELAISMNVNLATQVIENKSVFKKYHTTGKITLTEALKNRNRLFQANAEVTAKLKETCVALGLNKPLNDVEDLFSLDPPGGKEIIDPQSKKKIVLDGQAYCHQKSTEILTNLAAYYT